MTPCHPLCDAKKAPPKNTTPPVHNRVDASLDLPTGILKSDTATCYDCPDGVGHPSADGWTCHDCGAMWAYDESDHPH